MMPFRWNRVFLALALGASIASPATAQTKRPAKSAAKKAPAKPAPKSAPAKPAPSDDDGEVEGYIVQKTAQGYIRVPRKQRFKFSGSDVEGQGSRPNESNFGQRPQVRETSLIPIRSSFRPEILETAGQK